MVLYSLTFSSSAFAQNLTDGDTSNDVCLSLQTSLFRYQSKDSTINGEVSIIQDFLISKGMLSGTPTGFYGRLTVAGVKAYQKSVGVSPTGNVGPLTKSIMQKETCTNGGLGNGGTMYRDSSCRWHPEQCRDQNGNNKVTIESVGSNDGIGFYSIILSGNNFNQVNYIEEEHLVDGKQTISRSSFTSSSSNSIVFPLQVCQGCKYTSYINAVDKNGIKSNILPFLIDNTTPVPANALKAMSATLYNTKTSYVPDETIRFSLQGYDSNGQVATPAKGFNVQYHMYDMGVNGRANGVTTMINGIYQADNAVFNYKTNMWNITATAPNKNLASGSMRTLEASFYCSSTGLGCYENQIEKSFMFSIVNMPDPIINSFSINDSQQFSLDAKNYSSIAFKADCGNGVSVVISPDGRTASYPQGMSSLCNDYQYFQKPGVDTGIYVPIVNSRMSFWFNNTVDGSTTYVGSPQNMNTGDSFTLKVKVCNLVNKCAKAQAPGRFYAKG